MSRGWLPIAIIATSTNPGLTLFMEPITFAAASVISGQSFRTSLLESSMKMMSVSLHST